MTNVKSQMNNLFSLISRFTDGTAQVGHADVVYEAGWAGVTSDGIASSPRTGCYLRVDLEKKKEPAMMRAALTRDT